ncbi:MAG: hypothetical protein H0V74_05400 [Chloroflexi bacterium]|nr:hypothetical protein [Chloroflexota bacterium]
MKRRDLIRRIGEAARDRGLVWEMLRQGADHEVWSLGGHRITIPRHREVAERTARGVLKAFEDELGTRWWET